MHVAGVADCYDDACEERLLIVTIMQSLRCATYSSRMFEAIKASAVICMLKTFDQYAMSCG